MPDPIPPPNDLPEIVEDQIGADLFAETLIPSNQHAHQSGDLIGPYTLAEKLGDGGFGTVWLAEQTEPVRRTVALKILKLGMDTLEVMGRFELERRALALMDHPHIARVLDAGSTPEGRPFFAMEVVHGVPITQYCLERQLPLEHRLRLFQSVCAGVQHAHLKGIIHRDLKPSNILVTEIDGAPTPKIIDFGIAKATTTDRLTDFTLVTRADQLMGTPVYMSPEQADASSDIDTRSDVYALGAILYELLTGRPPFDRKTLHLAGYEEMRRVIREVEPRPPSEQTEKKDPPTALHGSRDLDLITLRALEKDRERRYESATALGQDIEHFLQHEPITARAPSTSYLIQRWIRRHRVMASASAICLLTLGIGTATTYWQKLQAQDALQLMASVVSETDTISYVRLNQMREVLHLAAARTDPLPSPQQLQLFTGLGKAYWGLGDWEEAIRYIGRALRLSAELQSPPKTHNELREILALCLLGGQRAAEAVTLTEQMMPEYEKDLYPDDPAKIFILTVHAKALRSAGRPEDAVTAFEDLFERLRNWPTEPNPIDIVNAHLSYPIALRQAGETEAALTEARKNIKMAKRLLGASDPRYIRALAQAANECRLANLLEEAHGYQGQALDLFADVLGTGHFSTQEAKNRLIELEVQLGRPDEALQIRRDLVTFAKVDDGPIAPETLNEIQQLIDALIAAGKHGEALTLAETTLNELRALPSPSREIIRDWLPTLGAKYEQLQRALPKK